MSLESLQRSCSEGRIPNETLEMISKLGWEPCGFTPEEKKILGVLPFPPPYLPKPEFFKKGNLLMTVLPGLGKDPPAYNIFDKDCLLGAYFYSEAFLEQLTLLIPIYCRSVTSAQYRENLPEITAIIKERKITLSFVSGWTSRIELSYDANSGHLSGIYLGSSSIESNRGFYFKVKLQDDKIVILDEMSIENRNTALVVGQKNAENISLSFTNQSDGDNREVIIPFSLQTPSFSPNLVTLLLSVSLEPHYQWLKTVDEILTKRGIGNLPGYFCKRGSDSSTLLWKINNPVIKIS